MMLKQNPFLQLAVIIGITAFLGTFASHQFEHCGDWQPQLPDTIGIWTATDTPLPQETLAMLGNPKSQGRVYTNLFQEAVSVSVISAGSFDNYHDPTVCGAGYGFGLTAKKVYPLDGPGSGMVRAMVWRRGEDRILYYYWLQNRGGSTDTAARMGNYRDIPARFRTGFSAIVQGEQTCIMRVYTRIHPSDPYGAQAQRNVDEIARALYRSLLPSKNTSN